MNYNFTFLISKPNCDDDEAANKLFNAGCDDCLLSCSNGHYELEFDRDGYKLYSAIYSAITGVYAANIGVDIEYIVLDGKYGKTISMEEFWRRYTMIEESV